MARALARRLLQLGVLAGTVAVMVGAAAAQDANGFDTYRNERHGFSLTYPMDRFIALPVATEDSRQFISRDGKARMQVGTLANFDGKSLGAYRDFLLKQSYGGADVTYAPVRGTWFVLSGIRNQVAFYQRVNFVCGGRAINSWMVQFPAAEKSVYAPVIEQIHKAYRLGEDASCNQRITKVGNRMP
jgi:hypothetical protein